VDPHGDLWVGSAQILEAARLIFTAPGWAKTAGKIEDVQFVGSKAAMATLVWEARGKPEKPNPGCVRMTVILTGETGRLEHRAGSGHRSRAAIPLGSCLTRFLRLSVLEPPLANRAAKVPESGPVP